MNFKAINKGFPKISTAFPLINDVLSYLGGKNYLAAADLTEGFHQIGVLPEDRDFLTILHPVHGKMRWTVWPFGFVLSP